MPPSPVPPPRKRSLPPNDVDDQDRSPNSRRRAARDDSPPWWEQQRNGGAGNSRSGDGGRYDDRRGAAPRYDNRRPAHDAHRRSVSSASYGGRGGREGRNYDGGRGAGAGDRYETTARSYGQSHDRHDRRASPGSSRQLEEGEIMLDYSDEPRRPIPPREPSHGSRPAAQSSASTAPSSATAPAQSLKSDGPELELEIPKPIDPEALIAERRRKRAEILAKYANTAPPSETSTRPGTPDVSTPGRVEVERETKRLKLGTESPGAGTPQNGSVHEAEGEFDLFKGVEQNEAIRVGEQDASTHVEGEQEVSAADYNPDEDRKNDDRRQAEKKHSGVTANPAQQAAPKVTSKPVDMTIPDDDDDDDDMFSIGHKVVVEDSAEDGKPAFVPIINRADATAGLTDNFDDAEGYYKLILGELLDNGRYHVQANLGKGMFSGVVRAKDMESKTGEEVAIKVIRSQESMFKAGMKEANILRKLQEADPEDKKHVIRLLRTFEHRGHLCLVFENLSMNLREVVKRFGKDVGINLRAVRAYASQMFLALALLRKCDIMHADIKPDNILVNESKSVLKVCDLGSASDVTENEITPYLVSRFYRAPEIILGLPYDCSLDTWSIGCTLYELYTGKILFPGRTNNHMLLLIMELKGKFNHKVLKKAKFTDQHFDESLNFMSLEKDGAIKTMALTSRPTHDLRTRLMPAAAMKKLKDDEQKMLGHFVDLLDKMLSLDPTKRPSPKELLSHPFLRV